MAVSSSIKNILNNVVGSTKNVAKSVAKNFDDVPFTTGLKKTTQPIVDKGAEYVGKAGTKIGATELGEKVSKGASDMSHSWVGQKVNDTGDFFRKHTYNQNAYISAKEKYKTDLADYTKKKASYDSIVNEGEVPKFNPGKEPIKPNKSDYRTGKLIDKDPDTFTGYRLNNIDSSVKWSMGLGAFAVAGVWSGGSAYISATEESKYGDIYGDLSVGTVNATYSPTHTKAINSAVNYDNTDAVGNMDADLSSRIGDVDANIVFALHELRNGGGM